MNYIAEAIDRAIENGWSPAKHREVVEYNPNNKAGPRKTVRASLTHWDIFSDPTFWQSLGKSEGWPTDYVDNFYQTDAWWKFQWHSFIDHLAEGRDAASFFQSLLTNEKEND